MTDLTDFPDDPRVYFIRYIDGYTQPHKGTESTSVRCYLAPIPLAWGSEPSKLDDRQIARLFSDKNSECFISTVFAGSLATYVAGQCFVRGEDGRGIYAGMLTAKQRRLGKALAYGEESRFFREHEEDFEAELFPCTNLGKGPSGEPIVVLPASQLYLHDAMAYSTKILVARDTKHPDERHQVQYIIPRTVIFRAFYAFSSTIADIFTAGPWNSVRSKAISEQEFAGHLTGIDDRTGSWKVVLALGMTLDDGPMMALFRFNHYAETRAKRIHEPILKAQLDAATWGEEEAIWYSNAEIPLDPTLGPYRGTVSGYFLRRRRDGGFAGRTFLVTAIHQMSFSKRLPAIAPILVNDATEGEKVIHTGGPRPHDTGNKGRKRRPNGKATVDTHEATEKRPGFDMPSISFAFYPKPRIIRLKKDQSFKYSSKRRKEEQEPTTEISGGRKAGRQEDLSHAHSAQEKREPSELLTGLMAILKTLMQKGTITEYRVVSPIESEQRVQVGAYPCWNFLGSDERKAVRSGKADWGTRSWVYLQKERSHYTALARTAFVIRVTLPNGLTGLWIETERRSKKDGTKEPIASAFVISSDLAIRAETAASLSIIRSCHGVSLSKAFESRGKICYPHPHYMEKAGSEKWSLAPLEAFFKSLAISQASLLRG
ncbi:hypothetical protein GTY70_05980 [Stenotrophomonas maltophilia]|uniref:hypothetical protein n=1 Tax=Stenotrophomonas maltophilia group TaxID=995085 RepID=UPI001F488A5C|nr:MULTISPECIES: hypothetical protein [Stenotrophomonas]MCF3463430.1 hypothetical protein [Stenotrophomonas maltophilia]MCF3507947.1 hypothetical protein [Stenotrophomonas maltophilia]MCU1082905.1 hypothetical protein [Stenotrophomonas maltophilia]MCU1155824.1 hypothetical protein [Stenotrophomonas maltophilia]MCU1167015.1 hypothetical protein [Stenotrophomonas maltophilia]